MVQDLPILVCGLKEILHWFPVCVLFCRVMMSSFQGASLAVAESGGVSFLSTARFTFAASSFCTGSAIADAVALGFDQLSPAHL